MSSKPFDKYKFPDAYFNENASKNCDIAIPFPRNLGIFCQTAIENFGFLKELRDRS